MTRSKDIVTGLIAIGLSVFLLFISGNVKDFAATGVGAAFLPRVAGVLLGLLGIVLTLQGWRQGAISRPTLKPPGRPAEQVGADEVVVFGGWLAVFLSIVLLCAYVGFLESLGFIVSSTIYAFCQMLILAKNAKWKFLQFGVISLTASSVAYFIFVRLFQVMLPPGILG